MKGFIVLLIIGVGTILFAMDHPIIAVCSWSVAGLVTETETVKGFIVLLIIGVGIRLFASGNPIIAVGYWLIAGGLDLTEHDDVGRGEPGDPGPCDCVGSGGCI